MEQSFLQALRSRGEQLSHEIIAWRRIFHQIPELRMDTPKTEAQIVALLQQMGITDIRQGVGGHGVCAVIEGAQPGKCLAIRADCDGLPIAEETGLPFASCNGNMHACGHDAHTAMALGAAKLILENRHLLKGRVKLIFQPFEEGDGGAKRMIEDHALRNPDVDAIIALHNHCTPDEDYEPGDVLVTDQPISANIYAYEAIFRGKTSHVCLAHSATNPIYMACDAVSRIAALARQDLETVNAVTMVHGGVRNNIIPETCSISGSVRCFDREKLADTKASIFATLEDCAKAHGGTVEVKATIDLMSTRIDSALYTRFCQTANTVYPNRVCRQLKEREMIGEDFARFADLIPALYFKLHTKPHGTAYPLHHPKFDVDEAVLHKGSILFAAFAFMWQ